MFTIGLYEYECYQTKRLIERYIDRSDMFPDDI
jgi:hypothetical protein